MERPARGGEGACRPARRFAEELRARSARAMAASTMTTNGRGMEGLAAPSDRRADAACAPIVGQGEKPTQPWRRRRAANQSMVASSISTSRSRSFATPLGETTSASRRRASGRQS